MNHPVLIINSYGGSLNIAAHDARAEIIASMEDHGFGIDAQKLNYPNLEYYDHRDEWPIFKRPSLRDAIVIAHPPCAAFSNMNAVNQARSSGKRYRGVNTDAFKCTVDVADYALGQKCHALAVESVQGAHEGARELHDRLGRTHGYNVYRILQNSITFGLPQWRPRFWVVFMKVPRFRVRHVPTYRSIGDILLKNPSKGTPVPENQMNYFLNKTRAAGVKDSFVMKTLFGGEHTGGCLPVGKKIFDLDETGPNYQEVRERLGLVGCFAEALPRILSPEGWSTVIFHSSFLICMGRELRVEEYHRIMGFPDNYQWPRNMARQFRLYLSKGVCPPVAEWLLHVIDSQREENEYTFLDYHARALKPGETADFQLKRKDVEHAMKNRGRHAAKRA